MAVDKQHLRHCMLYEFHLKKSAVEATKTICFAYGENVLEVRTCQNWFARFRSGDFDLNEMGPEGLLKQKTIFWKSFSKKILDLQLENLHQSCLCHLQPYPIA